MKNSIDKQANRQKDTHTTDREIRLETTAKRFVGVADATRRGSSPLSGQCDIQSTSTERRNRNMLGAVMQIMEETLLQL